MSSFSALGVLILTQNPQTARVVAEQLGGVAKHRWQSVGEVPAGAIVEIVVTDFPSRTGDMASDTTKGAGIVGFDRADWADVKLSSSFSPGELRVACLLLAEVVRLRAQREQIAQVRDEVEQLAHTDPLSGLPNRRAWDRQWPLKGRAAVSSGRPLWLGIVDLDRLKRVNESGGLSLGDEVLHAAAGAMAGALRRDDLIARLGGDEFGVLLAGVDETGAAAVFERLRAAVAACDMPQGVEGMTVSIGYAGANGDAAQSELFAAAERALGEAKQAGGNRAVRGEVTGC